MWPFARNPVDLELQGVKTVRLSGYLFKIRRINPLLDFSHDKIPQIFTDFKSKRPANPNRKPNASQEKRNLVDLEAMLKAGLVEPGFTASWESKPKDEETLTIQGLLRSKDPELASKLYIEILTHSLNRFKGLRGVFFSILIRRRLYTLYRSSMDSHLRESLSQMAA